MPSESSSGRATKPGGWSFRQAFRSSARRPRAIPDCCGGVKEDIGSGRMNSSVVKRVYGGV